MHAMIARPLALGGLLLALSSTAALAQTDASPAASSAPGQLPAVPNSERAAEGGLTGGHPSLPGPGGQSPLEPYLVTWLLPASGILVAIAVLATDKALRNHP